MITITNNISEINKKDIYKYVFLSDIHFATWEGDMLSKYLLSTQSKLRKAIKLGTLNDSPSAYKTILIFGGDVWNSLDYEKGYKGARKGAGFILGKQLKIIKNILEENGDLVSHVYLGVGNHEFYNSEVRKGNLSRFQGKEISTQITLEIVSEVFSNSQVFSDTILSHKVNDYSLYSCVLYSPLLSLGQYDGITSFLKNTLDRESDLSGQLSVGINDFKYFDNSSNEFDLDLSDLEGIVEQELLDFYKKTIRTWYNNSNGRSGYAGEKIMGALTKTQLQFFYDLFTFFKSVKSNDSEKLMLNFHFPFNWKQLVSFSVLELKNYQDLGEVNMHRTGGDLQLWYMIDGTWFEWFMEKLQLLQPQVKEVIFLNGHTHENFYFESEYKGIQLKILENCLGYGI